MSANEQVVWRKHPTSPKWHAYAPGQASACGLTDKAVGEGQTEVPPWPDACWRCCQELGVKTSGRRGPPRPPVVEPMMLEFIGGPLDGVRIVDVPVVVEDATRLNFTILEGHYQKRRTPMPEQQPAKEPWQA